MRKCRIVPNVGSEKVASQEEIELKSMRMLDSCAGREIGIPGDYGEPGQNSRNWVGRREINPSGWKSTSFSYSLLLFVFFSCSLSCCFFVYFKRTSQLGSLALDALMEHLALARASYLWIYSVCCSHLAARGPPMEQWESPEETPICSMEGSQEVFQRNTYEQPIWARRALIGCDPKQHVPLTRNKQVVLKTTFLLRFI